MNHQPNSHRRSVRGVIKVVSLHEHRRCRGRRCAAARGSPFVLRGVRCGQGDQGNGFGHSLGLAEPAWLDSPDRDRALRAHRGSRPRRQGRRRSGRAAHRPAARGAADWAFEIGSPNGLMRQGWTRNSLKARRRGHRAGLAGARRQHELECALRGDGRRQALVRRLEPRRHAREHSRHARSASPRDADRRVAVASRRSETESPRDAPHANCALRRRLRSQPSSHAACAPDVHPVWPADRCQGAGRRVARLRRRQSRHEVLAAR